MEPEHIPAVDARTKLLRYCFLGNLEPVYVFSRTLNVAKYYPRLQVLCKSLDDVAMLSVLRQALLEATLVRRDEPIFVYAVYLLSDVDIKWKTEMRKLFPALILNDEDLFMFCKYAKLIQKENGREKAWLSNTTRKAITSWYEKQSPQELKQIWLMRRGEHGFTHKTLLQLCHISDEKIGGEGVVKPFFKTCTELLKAAENSGEAPTTSAEASTSAARKKAIVKKAESNTEISSSEILSVSKLRTTKKTMEAQKIIRKFKLRCNQVPPHLLRQAQIWEVLIPNMSYRQLLKSWSKLLRYKVLQNSKVMQMCRRLFENRRLLREDNIHPIVFLMQMRDLSLYDRESEVSQLLPKKKPSKEKKSVRVNRFDTRNIQLFQELFDQSFGQNKATGLRMHITINITNNYRRKALKNHVNLGFLEAAIAVAFAYFKKEKQVDVFFWLEKNLGVGQLQWQKNFKYVDALNYSNAIDITNSKQILTDPILNSMQYEQIYDVFLVIVPTAGRNNRKQCSESLCEKLDKYRERKNPKARFIILDLRKHRRSMRYSKTRVENILEICGLDDHSTELIENFGLHLFD